jgi:exodeoxyribonuclease V alpha subunit
MEEIAGYIENIVFTHEETGFTVAKIQEDDKNHLTCIVGTMQSIHPGETLLCQGEWKTHATHGKQFEVQSFEVKEPSSIIGIKKYLESGLIKGIGPIYAKKIVDTFGVATLDIIEHSPNRLKDIPGIGLKKIKKIKECWDTQKSIRDVIIFLRSYNISSTFAQKIYNLYQDKSIEKVKANPYQLARDIIGIGFTIADNIAMKLGFDKTSSFRVIAGVEHVLWEMSTCGHTCYKKEELIQLVLVLLSVDTSLIENAIVALEKDCKIVLSQINDEIFVWLKSLHYFEKGIAKELKRILHNPAFIRQINGPKAITWVQDKLYINLAQEQKDAVIQGVRDKLSIITGGPGTGKSTITNAILKISDKVTNKILLAAPTGRAAKRMSQITRKKAFTIHCLLEFDFVIKGFKKNSNNPLSCSLIIIDEASMIDTMLMYHLLKAIPDTARVVFIGDIDQLPSVGPGYVLKDMILSEVIPTTRLTKIFRQSSGSKIITNAHRINSGIFPEMKNTKGSDFYFFEINEPSDIEAKILELVNDTIPKSRSFHAIDDIQVLSPMKKGRIGTENLNTLLQEELNPSKNPFYRLGKKYHIGDKVMQIKNNYNKHIYNGDIGKIIDIDLEEQIMSIIYDRKIVVYEFSELDEITLSYAVSVHKYQGSECPCVIIPIHTSHFKLLYKNLLYTAVTRGKKLVVIVGTKQAVALAIKNNEVLKRYTGLETSIRQCFMSKDNNQQTMLPGF